MKKPKLVELRHLLLLLTILALTFMPMVVNANNQATVTINATPVWISITNTNKTFDFGYVTAGATNATANTTTDYLDITNAGSVAVDTTIVCNNWTHVSGSNNWTYGAPGANTGELVYSVGTGAYDTIVGGTTPTALMTNLDISTTDYFEVGLDAPTSFTHGDKQQTTLTITATQHT